MKLSRIKEIYKKLQPVYSSHENKDRIAFQIFSAIESFLSSEFCDREADTSEIKFNVFKQSLQYEAMSKLRKLPESHIIRRVIDSWENNHNQVTFLESDDILDIPDDQYLLLEGGIYSAKELSQNIDQDHYYRHPESGAFFTRQDIIKLDEIGLTDYAKKLRTLYDEQYSIPETIVQSLYEMLGAYYANGLKSDGKLEFTDDALKDCEIAKAEFMKIVYDHSSEEQAKFFNCLVRCHYSQSRLPDITVDQLLRPDETNYNGCVIVEQIRLWFLLTSRYPRRFCFPQALHNRTEFNLGHYRLPPGVQLGKSFDTKPIVAETLPAKRAKRESSVMENSSSLFSTREQDGGDAFSTRPTP